MDEGETVKVLKAYWSDQYVAKGYPTCFWKTEQSCEVEVCLISSDPSRIGWTDFRYIGDVVQYVREGGPDTSGLLL